MANILTSKLVSRRLLRLSFQKLIFGLGGRAQGSCIQQINQRPAETHDDKNKRLGRPLSPHLTIYAPQITSVLSILHRITGCIASSYLIGLAFFALSSPYSFCAIVDFIECLEPSTLLCWISKFVISAPFLYHTCTGVRHIIWDVTAKFLSMTMVRQTGFLVLGAVTLSIMVSVFIL